MLEYFHFRLITLLLINAICRANGLFSSLSEPRYEVRLKTEPAPMNLDYSIISTVDVYSKHGQKFRCQVPAISSGENSPAPAINNSFIDSALSDLNGTRCLTKTVNWWTYELCYKRQILQFHLENGERQSETLIGRFQSETNWNEVNSTTSGQPLAHNQTYVNGSVCSLTFKLREANVEYKCIPGDDSFHITSVEELETCVYRLEVSAPTLCEHPSFVAEKQAPTEPILCNPILPADVVAQEKVQSSPTSGSLHRRSEKRVMTVANILLKRHEDQFKRMRRSMKRKLRQFILHLVDPASEEILNLGDVLPRLHLAEVFPRLFRSPIPIHLEQIDTFLYSTAIGDIHLPSRFTLELDPIPLRGLTIIRSMASFLVALADAKIKHIIEPNSQTIHFNSNGIKLAVETFNEICKELEKPHDSDFFDVVAYDLEMLYHEYGWLETADAPVLVGKSVDGKNDISLALRSPKILRWSWSWTPSSVHVLRLTLSSVKEKLDALDKYVEKVKRMQRFSGVESSFEKQLKVLLTNMASKVLVVRSMAEKLNAKSNKEDGDADDEDSDPESANFDTMNHALKSDIMQQLTSMIEKVLSRVPADHAQDLEIYEAGGANGHKTFYIISSEDRGKEQRRMKAQENAYNFVGGKGSSDSNSKASSRKSKV